MNSFITGSQSALQTPALNSVRYTQEDKEDGVVTARGAGTDTRTSRNTDQQVTCCGDPTSPRSAQKAKMRETPALLYFCLFSK